MTSPGRSQKLQALLDGEYADTRERVRWWLSTPGNAAAVDLPIEERRIGGLGVHIVKALMDTFDYRRENEKNIVTLTKQVQRLG